MKKRLSALLLALTLTFAALTACGDSSQADSRKTESSSKAETTTTAEESSSEADSSSKAETTTTTTTAEATTTTEETTSTTSETEATTTTTTQPETTTTTTQATTRATTRATTQSTTQATTLATTKATTKSTTKSTTIATTKATTKAPSKANKVIYSDQNVTITYKGYTIDKILGYGEFNLLIENKNQIQSIGVYIDNVVLNGYMIEPTFYATVEPGTKANAAIYFDKMNTEKSGITLNSVKYTELVFKISNNSFDRRTRVSYSTKRVRISV